MLFLAGGAAALHALSFDVDSRMFPLIVAILLATTGAGVVLHSIIKPSHAIMLAGRIRPAVYAATIIAAWAAAFSGGAGFVLPTFLMQVGLLWIAGLRRRAYIAGIAVLVTALAYLLFVVLLDIPLPPSLLPSALQGF